MTRRILLLSLVLLLPAVLAQALPQTLDDLPMDIRTDAPYMQLSVDQDGHIRVETDWDPLYAQDAYMKILYADTSVYLYPDTEGTFVSECASYDASRTQGMETMTMISEGADETQSETIILDGSGNLLVIDVTQGTEALTYGLLDAGENLYGYAYSREKTGASLPVMEYAATFDRDGLLLTYETADDQNVITRYTSSGDVSAVEALIPPLETAEVFSRIYWDFSDRIWRDRHGNPVNADGTDLTHLTPPPPAVTSAVRPTPTPKPTIQTGEPTPSATSHADATPTPPQGDAAPTPKPTGSTASAPIPEGFPQRYDISAPPESVQSLVGAASLSSLQHLPLGQLWRSGNALALEDEGYQSAEIVYNTGNTQHVIPLYYDRDQNAWLSVSLPDNLPSESDWTVHVEAGGIATEYQGSLGLSSYLTARPQLRYRDDDTYVYDGTGRENVTAVYDASGTLTSYSFHSRDGSRAITYTPYGDVLTYSSLSDSGILYQYDQSDGWKMQYGEGNWFPCQTPQDVGFDELPPLILWQPPAAENPSLQKGRWFKYNTVGILGIPLREWNPKLTREWYHVVPVDLSQDGVQSFSLVAGNMYYVGRLFVIVEGDCVSVDYRLADGYVYPKGDFFRFFASMDEITTDFLEHPTESMQYRKCYSIENDLDGQEIQLLFVCNLANYRLPVTNSGAMLKRFYSGKKEVRALRKQAEALLQYMEEEYNP
ncbi:MAG: hypothetical protein IJ246_10540 [Clostridia bacterium]|nr:hypothetical protein [Clostridia bacterium]